MNPQSTEQPGETVTPPRPPTRPSLGQVTLPSQPECASATQSSGTTRNHHIPGQPPIAPPSRPPTGPKRPPSYALSSSGSSDQAVTRHQSPNQIQLTNENEAQSKSPNEQQPFSPPTNEIQPMSATQPPPPPRPTIPPKTRPMSSNDSPALISGSGTTPLESSGTENVVEPKAPIRPFSSSLPTTSATPPPRPATQPHRLSVDRQGEVGEGLVQRTHGGDQDTTQPPSRPPTYPGTGSLPPQRPIAPPTRLSVGKESALKTPVGVTGAEALASVPEKPPPPSSVPNEFPPAPPRPPSLPNTSNQLPASADTIIKPPVSTQPFLLHRISEVSFDGKPGSNSPDIANSGRCEIPPPRPAVPPSSPPGRHEKRESGNRESGRGQISDVPPPRPGVFPAQKQGGLEMVDDENREIFENPPPRPAPPSPSNRDELHKSEFDKRENSETPPPRPAVPPSTQPQVGGGLSEIPPPRPTTPPTGRLSGAGTKGGLGQTPNDLRLDGKQSGSATSLPAWSPSIDRRQSADNATTQQYTPPRPQPYHLSSRPTSPSSARASTTSTTSTSPIAPPRPFRRPTTDLGQTPSSPEKSRAHQHGTLAHAQSMRATSSRSSENIINHSSGQNNIPTNSIGHRRAHSLTNTAVVPAGQSHVPPQEPRSEYSMNDGDLKKGLGGVGGANEQPPIVNSKNTIGEAEVRDRPEEGKEAYDSPQTSPKMGREGLVEKGEGGEGMLGRAELVFGTERIGGVCGDDVRGDEAGGDDEWEHTYETLSAMYVSLGSRPPPGVWGPPVRPAPYRRSIPQAATLPVSPDQVPRTPSYENSRVGMRPGALPAQQLSPTAGPASHDSPDASPKRQRHSDVTIGSRELPPIPRSCSDASAAHRPARPTTPPTTYRQVQAQEATPYGIAVVTPPPDSILRTFSLRKPDKSPELARLQQRPLPVPPTEAASPSRSPQSTPLSHAKSHLSTATQSDADMQRADSMEDGDGAYVTQSSLLSALQSSRAVSPAAAGCVAVGGGDLSEPMTAMDRAPSLDSTDYVRMTTDRTNTPPPVPGQFPQSRDSLQNSSDLIRRQSSNQYTAPPTVPAPYAKSRLRPDPVTSSQPESNADQDIGASSRVNPNVTLRTESNGTQEPTYLDWANVPVVPGDQAQPPTPPPRRKSSQPPPFNPSSQSLLPDNGSGLARSESETSSMRSLSVGDGVSKFDGYENAVDLARRRNAESIEGAFRDGYENLNESFNGIGGEVAQRNAETGTSANVIGREIPVGDGYANSDDLERADWNSGLEPRGGARLGYANPDDLARAIGFPDGYVNPDDLAVAVMAVSKVRSSDDLPIKPNRHDQTVLASDRPSGAGDDGPSTTLYGQSDQRNRVAGSADDYENLNDIQTAVNNVETSESCPVLTGPGSMQNSTLPSPNSNLELGGRVRSHSATMPNQSRRRGRSVPDQSANDSFAYPPRPPLPTPGNCQSQWHESPRPNANNQGLPGPGSDGSMNMSQDMYIESREGASAPVDPYAIRPYRRGDEIVDNSRGHGYVDPDLVAAAAKAEMASRQRALQDSQSTSTPTPPLHPPARPPVPIPGASAPPAIPPGPSLRMQRLSSSPTSSELTRVYQPPPFPYSGPQQPHTAVGPPPAYSVEAEAVPSASGHRRTQSSGVNVDLGSTTPDWNRIGSHPPKIGRPPILTHSLTTGQSGPIGMSGDYPRLDGGQMPNLGTGYAPAPSAPPPQRCAWESKQGLLLPTYSFLALSGQFAPSSILKTSLQAAVDRLAKAHRNAQQSFSARERKIREEHRKEHRALMEKVRTHAKAIRKESKKTAFVQSKESSEAQAMRIYRGSFGELEDRTYAIYYTALSAAYVELYEEERDIYVSLRLAEMQELLNSVERREHKSVDMQFKNQRTSLEKEQKQRAKDAKNRMGREVWENIVVQEQRGLGNSQTAALDSLRARQEDRRKEVEKFHANLLAQAKSAINGFILSETHEVKYLIA